MNTEAENEIWVDLNGYKGLYQISNAGRLKLLQRKRANGLLYSEKITIGSLDSYGYRRTTLTKNQIRIDKKIHQLVAEHFISNPEKIRFVNHKDGNKQNNNVCNLQWMSRADNNYHAYQVLGKNLKGSRNGRATLTEDQAKEIKENSTSASTDREYAKKFKTRFANVQSIRLGLTWKHL